MMLPWENVETRNKIWLLRKSARLLLLYVGKKPIIRMYGGSASSFKRGIVTDVTFVAVPLCAMGHKVELAQSAL